MSEAPALYVCSNCGRLAPISGFQDECAPGWTHGRLIRVQEIAEAALVARDEENHTLREALERIALGISGRTESGLRSNEGGGYGLPRQPKPDWQLAKEALAVSRPAQTDNEEKA